MFVLIRTEHMQLRSHACIETVKPSKCYAMYTYTVLNLECYKCTTMRWQHCASGHLVVLRMRTLEGTLSTTKLFNNVVHDEA